MALVMRFVNVVVAVVTLANMAGAVEPASGRGMKIFFIDVQGGAATLVVTPAGESVLIDSGWPGFEDRDPRRIVHVLKDVAKCERLDHLITTHWHTDHYGGVAGLARLVPIGRFWDRGLPEDPDVKPDFPDGPRSDDPLGRAYRRASAGKRTRLKAGDSVPLDPVRVLVLASGGEILDAGKLAVRGQDASTTRANPLCADAPPDMPPDRSDNSRSLAVLFSLGKFQFFDGGDLTWNVEKRLVCPIDLIGKVDLYQVTHHGMDISNYPTLVQTVQPVVAIMNNGPRKGGSPATVKLLRSISSIKAAYQLHKNAATSVEDNTDLALIANKDAAGGEFIQVSVAPDGSKFSVRIGENGTERAFESQ